MSCAEKSEKTTADKKKVFGKEEARLMKRRESNGGGGNYLRMKVLLSMMDINVPIDVSREIKTTSTDLGIPTEEFVRRALITYLDDMKAYLDLKKEIEAWEQASTEDFLNFLRIEKLEY